MEATMKFALAIAGLSLLAGAPSQAGQPPCATSDDTYNTACGSLTLENNTGSQNTAIGAGALDANSSGNYNTASGVDALDNNTTGTENTAAGDGALFSNTTGSENSAIGASALIDNTTGSNNTASGFVALYLNTTGNDNTATGYQALYANSTGINNTANGANALAGNTTGRGNIAVGVNALDANSIGGGNTVLGNGAITKIYAKVTSITALSDRREKKDIAPLGSELGLGFIEKLQPVSYRFRNGDQTQRYGFIAQDLEQALPKPLQDKVEHAKPEHGVALIERENDAKRTYRVAYGELTAPLVKAVQELKADNDALKADNAELKVRLARIEAAMAKFASASPEFREATLAPAH